MKKTIYLLLLLLPGISCFSQKIGVVAGKEYKIVYDLGQLKKSWEAVLTEQKITASLTDFSIVKTKAPGVTVSSYLLLGTTKGKAVKMARPLEFRKDGFYLKPYPMGKTNNGLSDNLVICQGCSNGCDPQVDKDGTMVCTPCKQGNNCKKTSRVATDDMVTRKK